MRPSVTLEVHLTLICTLNSIIDFMQYILETSVVLILALGITTCDSGGCRNPGVRAVTFRWYRSPVKTLGRCIHIKGRIIACYMTITCDFCFPV